MVYPVPVFQPDKATYTCQYVLQVAHGFNVGEQVLLDPNTGDWVLALADDQTTLRMATVAQVIGADRFVVGYEGRMFWPAHGLTIGVPHYLSGDTPGAITEGPPSNTTYFKQPVLIPLNVDEVRLLEYVVPDGSSTTGGGLFQQIDNLPAGPNWHRLGRLGGFCVTELLIQGFSSGVNTSSISVTVGSDLIASPNDSSNLRLNSRSGNSVIQNVRLNADGGITYVEVLTVASLTPYSIAVTVVSDSSPRAGTGWQFDPTFQVSPGGVSVASFPAFINNVSPTNPGIQWAIADGNTGDGFWLQNRQFRMTTPLSMEGRIIRNVGAPSNATDAVRYTDVRSIRATVLWASGTIFTSNQHNALFQFAVIPIEWNGRQVRIDYIVQLSRGSGNILTKSWMRIQGQGENGRLISEFTGTDTGITGSQASISASMVYTIPAGGASNLVMELRNNSSAGNWNFVNTTGTPSLAIMRLADVI